jgi:beta-glucosidase
LNFGATNGRVLYGEDVFVGYRFYEKIRRAPLFGFGYVNIMIQTTFTYSYRCSYGLSYTTFSLSNLSVSQKSISLTVKNTGSMAGAEVIQVYISAKDSRVNRPDKELNGFEKVFLQPGESKRVDVSVDAYAGSFWDESDRKWKCEKGEYEVLVGTSCQDIALRDTFAVEKTRFWLGV